MNISPTLLLIHACLLCFFNLSSQTLVASEKIAFKEIKCNSQVNPTCIEDQHPKLSWVIQSNGFQKSQSAYQVIVATSPKKLQAAKADIWDSGKTKSSNSIHVKLNGKPLEPLSEYYWKVRIWDESGNQSQWSPMGTIRTGLMGIENWKEAEWISLTRDTRKSEHRFRKYQTGAMKQASMVTSNSAGFFRKTINQDEKPESVYAYICGLGYYELYINGEKVGDRVLDPPPSNYNKQAYYVSYNITESINKGENAIGIILGNGFYGQNISWKRDPESEKDLSYGTPAVKLIIYAKYKNGRVEEFITDETWKCSSGPIVFDNIYGGDTYDARYELENWNRTEYNDTSWDNAKVETPALKEISADQMPPIKRLKTLKPTNVFKSSKGKWIVDFGQNIAGWVRINVKEQNGQVVNIRTTEALDTSGTDIFLGSTGGGANGMPQIYTYICKGNQLETWEPKFSYHGFRYAEITGVSSKPDEKMISAIVVANDVEHTGSFSCSDPLLVQMDTVSKWTVVDNLHGIPEDCPHREKCGWLGDAHAFCEYALYNFDMKSFYEKYMIDIQTQRRLAPSGDNTQSKFMVPTMIAPGKRTSTIAKLDWGIATIYLPWYNYLYYGDSQIIEDYYTDMKELTNYYLSFKNEDGIISNGMGDWCPPLWDRKSNPSAMECHPVISASAYFYDIMKIMQTFASVVGDDTYEDKMRKELEELKVSFNKKYLEKIPLVNLPWYGSQTATILALQFGLVSKDKELQVVDGLIFDIQARKGGHHSTGIHGNRYLYSILSKYNKADLAYQVLTTPSFPSQAYVLNQGFTTWPERQFYWEDMPGKSNSLNHPMHSGFAAYFYEILGGIKPTLKGAGFKEFTIDVIPPSSIENASVTIPTPYGDIKNQWEKANNSFTMNVEIPFNTVAHLNINDTDLKTLVINNKASDSFEVTSSGNLILGSGQYNIKYSKINISKK